MGLFSRLLGNKPPALRAGARAYVDGYGPLRDHYCVRIATGPDLSSDDARSGPVFETASGAQMYRDWVVGVATLDWNINGVGALV